jgi:serpin B
MYFYRKEYVMRKMLLLFMIPVLLLGIVGCGQKTAAGEVLQSEKPRNTAPELNETDLTTLVNGNNSFAFSLYQVLKEENSNLFYSPYSISAALAMTYAGARGDTEKAMAEALHFDLSQDHLHPAFNGLDLQLEQRGEGAKGMDGEGFRLNIVNAIWGQKDYRFLDEFLDVLAQNYGAGLRIVDFINEPEQSRLTINQWVSDQTEGKIEDLIPQGVINQLTRLVLTNAIYFNAAWEHQFQEGSTADGPFHLLDGGEVTVPMMHQTESFGYMEGDGYQAVELPYDGRELSMVILLPEEGGFNAFEDSLDMDLINPVLDKLEVQRVALTMPKFEYESSFGLKDALTTLGMGVAFTPDADLSGMDGKHDLFIQDVVHKAFVAVDESGTEAAAATAVVVGLTAMPAEPVTMTIDRPFLFFIRDIQTGSIIFIGRVLNPIAG